MKTYRARAVFARMGTGELAGLPDRSFIEEWTCTAASIEEAKATIEQQAPQRINPTCVVCAVYVQEMP